MQGPTPREQDMILASGGPATGINLALAELSLFWDNHRKNAPDIRGLCMNIRIPDEGTTQDRINAVAAIADWLGVEMHERHGCYIAQQRFGTGLDYSITVEAHYTPDPARAHLERLAAKKEATQAAPKFAGAA